jgi:hypothetical protein
MAKVVHYQSFKSVLAQLFPHKNPLKPAQLSQLDNRDRCHFCPIQNNNNMIHIQTQPPIQPYRPASVFTSWGKAKLNGNEIYNLEFVEDALVNEMNTGPRNRWPVRTGAIAFAKLALLESGAVLASFPLLGKLPGIVSPDPYSVWFQLDLPTLIPAGIFGQEIRIDPGRYLMASSMGSWLVFFKPMKLTEKPLF